MGHAPKLKLKTNKAARKRFKVTGRGKVLKSKTGRRHLLTDKKASRKRKLRRWDAVPRALVRKIKSLLPYG